MSDYKNTYSIYILLNKSPINILEGADDNKLDEIEIYDEDINNKKYSEEIKYFRKIIDEYDIMNKELKIMKYLNIGDSNFKGDIENIINLFNTPYEYANEIIMKFFIEKNMTELIVKEYFDEMNKLDLEFKDLYHIFNEKYDYVRKLNNKVKEKEEYFLNLLEENVDNEILTNDINNKLDKIIDFHEYIYKINNSYIQVDTDKIMEYIEYIDNLS